MKIIENQINIKGEAISTGIVKGLACHYQAGSAEQTAIFKITKDSIANEINKLYQAIEKSKIDLLTLVNNVKKMLGEKEAKIFETHIIILEDKNVINKIIHKIKNSQINVEYAVKSVFEEIENVFLKMDDEYLKDRGTDISELKRRLLSHFTGESGKFLCANHCIVNKGEGRIVLTKDLTSSMINLIHTENVKGFITEFSGKSSHAAILIRAAGIPCITVKDFINNIKCGSLIILDADNEKAVINPDIITEKKYDRIINKNKKDKKSDELIITPKIITKDNIEIEIFANLIDLIDLENIKKNSFSGIGLVRTEFLFYENRFFPTAKEQEKVYSKIIKEMNGKPVTFRLFDLGGDKKIKSLNFNTEENPMLGLRGIRYLIKFNKILEDQIKAILKASEHGEIKILIPMVSDINEIITVKKIINSIKNKLKLNKKIPIGMMFEVPSAVIDPEPFLKVIDFGSIGSNDLIQYLFGVDRNNQEVNYLYNTDNNVLFKLLKNLMNAADKLNIGITLCGEIDYENDFLFNLIKIGIKKFSISPIGLNKFYNKIKNQKS